MKHPDVNPVKPTRPAAPAKAAATVHVLSRGTAAWLLEFEGQRCVLAHSRGLLYLAYLLAHPRSEPIHALRLEQLAPAAPAAGATIPSLEGTGYEVAETHSYVVQKGGSQNEFQALRQLRDRARSLQAILDDPEQCETVRAEAETELSALTTALQEAHPKTRDAASRSVRAVRRAINRTLQALTDACDAQGQPAPVPRAFALHLHRFIMVPSSRYIGPRARISRSELAGAFRYEPPRNVIWKVS